jgi:hypothetical protein
MPSRWYRRVRSAEKPLVRGVCGIIQRPVKSSLAALALRVGRSKESIVRSGLDHGSGGAGEGVHQKAGRNPLRSGKPTKHRENLPSTIGHAKPEPERSVGGYRNKFV